VVVVSVIDLASTTACPGPEWTAATRSRVRLICLVRHLVPGKKKVGAENARRRERRGRDDRIYVVKTRQIARNARADHESKTERNADDGERFRAILRLGYVADVGLRDREIAGRAPIDHSRQKNQPDLVRHRQHDEAEECADLTYQQHGTPPHPVRKPAQKRPGDQLA